MRMREDIEDRFPGWAKDVLELLDTVGEAWVVGGFVRDALRGAFAADIDFACSLPAETTMAALKAAGYTVIPTGIEHGTVTALSAGHPLEITAYRKDGAYSDSRHPDAVLPASTIEEDLARRDFTVNALAWHPERGIVDPYGGAQDLEDGIIRCVGKPRERLTEDALRILRALRFASQLDFTLERETDIAVRDLAGIVERLSGERVLRELNKLLCGPAAARVLRAYPDVLAHIIPEISLAVGFPQMTKYHCFDVWEHIIHVVDAAPAEPLVRWAALLHDLGKPATHIVTDGVSHFYGHAEESARIVRHVARDLKMPKVFAENLYLLVLHHDDTIPPDERGISRFMRKGPWTPQLFFTLCDLKAADALGHAPDHQGRAATAIEMAAILSDMISRGDPFDMHDLAIGGSDLIAAGFAPGPSVGRVLRKLLEEVVEEDLPNEPEVLFARAGELFGTA